VTVPGARIVVAHPATQHSYQTALAVQQHGWLQAYLTGIYYKPRGLLAAMVALLPANARAKAERQLLRRQMPALDQDRIHSFPLGELLHRAGVIDFQSMIERFDRLSARQVLTTKPDAVICYDTCALRTFRAAERVGAVRILDQTIGHLTQARRVFAAHHVEFSVSEDEIRKSIDEAAGADFILAGSDYVKTGLLEIGIEERRVFVVPYAVNTQTFAPRPRVDDREYRILFIGRVSHKKGIRHLVDAFTQLGLPDARLHIAGHSVDGAAWARPYGNRIVYHGQIPHHEVHRLYNECDVFALPSLHEGSSLVIYEALASGLPVITTPNAGSVVTDGADGFVVPVGDAAAIRERLVMLHDGALRRLMAHNARRTAERYSWPDYRERVGKVLAKIAGRM
jgi:glycosyltransferase involved in cell wall biosynthesis